MRIVVIIVCFLSTLSFAQTNMRDSSRNTLIVGANYKANLTGGDLMNRWGFNSAIGLDIEYKLKSNLIFGLNSSFVFGNTFKDTAIFSNLYNSSGHITSYVGEEANILYLLRGMTAHASVGYVFTRFGNNANSGIWVSGGLGFMAHKIRIESLYDVVPQLEGDYRKGYDKLSMGFSTRQFVGYLFQSNFRLIRFYGGFEFVQGFTVNMRNYNFDTGGPETNVRFDALNSFKVGWIIPIAQRTRGEFYYD
jgi:hypothetical protein